MFKIKGQDDIPGSLKSDGIPFERLNEFELRKVLFFPEFKLLD